MKSYGVPRLDHLCYDNEKKQVGIAQARKFQTLPGFPRLDGLCYDNENTVESSMCEKAAKTKYSEARSLLL